MSKSSKVNVEGMTEKSYKIIAKNSLKEFAREILESIDEGIAESIHKYKL